MESGCNHIPYTVNSGQVGYRCLLYRGQGTKMARNQPSRFFTHVLNTKSCQEPVEWLHSSSGDRFYNIFSCFDFKAGEVFEIGDGERKQIITLSYEFSVEQLINNFGPTPSMLRPAFPTK